MMLQVRIAAVGRGRAPIGAQGAHSMGDMMDGMGWMMTGMGLAWLLVLVLIVLGIAALVKYLRTR